MPAHPLRKSDPAHAIPERSSVSPIALDDIRSERVRVVYQAWNRWRGARTMPTRNEIVLKELGNAAANISLVRVLAEENDYEFRVIGDAHIQAYGLNYQGKRMSSVLTISPRYGKLLRSTYDMICAMRRPYAFRGTIGLDAPDIRFAGFETCYLPLGPSPDEVDFVMNAAVYYPQGGAWG